jgi:hypothetical protein
MKTFEVTNAGTVYRVHRIENYDVEAEIGERQRTVWLVESGWGRNYGEWIELALRDNSIAWNYLAEKMPVMGKREGDKPGWIKAFKAASLEVFG